MKIRHLVLGAVLVIVGLPPAVVLIAAATIYVLDQTNGTIVSLGQQRSYLLHVPPGHDSTKATPLVISLHGAAGWPAQQMNLSRWNRLADEQDFLVVYPAGSGFPRIWHVSQGPELMQDVGFIAALIDTLRAAHDIDSARIFVDGMSNGGGMAFVLSCTLSGRVAAVGLVAAAQTLPWSWCPDGRPVPMMAFHGTADPIVPYGGGRSPIAPDLFPSIPIWTEQWARRNRCDPSPLDSAMAMDVSRREYVHCADGAPVVLYSVRGGGHTWPGGKPMPEWLVGPTSRSIDATRQLWAFFSAHPRPRH
jgi:polyhydroxybutyrate depolymerase